MAKKTSKKRIKVHTIAVNRLVMGLVTGLILALVGFLWNDEVNNNPEIVSANAVSGLLAAFGLILAVASVLMLIATIMTTESRSK